MPVCCAAMALTDDSVSLDDPVLRKIDRLAIFMGTKGAGLGAKTIAGCDHAVRIPMAHGAIRSTWPRRAPSPFGSCART